MDRFGIGITIIFGLLAFVVRTMPHWLTWPGIAVGLLLFIWGVPPISRVAPGPAILFILCGAGIVASVAWALDSGLAPDRENQIAMARGWLRLASDMSIEFSHLPEPQQFDPTHMQETINAEDQFLRLMRAKYEGRLAQAGAEMKANDLPIRRELVTPMGVVLITQPMSIDIWVQQLNENAHKILEKNGEHSD